MRDLPTPPRDPADVRRTGPVDVHIGGRLRVLRKLNGVSQVALADALGVSFQQIQKYEAGKDRIPAARLYDASQALACPIPAFFEGLVEVEAPSATPSLPAPAGG